MLGNEGSHSTESRLATIDLLGLFDDDGRYEIMLKLRSTAVRF